MESCSERINPVLHTLLYYYDIPGKLSFFFFSF